jgi:hypothetical protein
LNILIFFSAGVWFYNSKQVKKINVRIWTQITSIGIIPISMGVVMSFMDGKQIELIATNLACNSTL